MEKKQKKFKFNVIDVIVILVLLAVVVFFAVRVINFEATAPEPASSTQVLRYTVRVDAMPASIYEEVSSPSPARCSPPGPATTAWSSPSPPPPPRSRTLR